MNPVARNRYPARKEGLFLRIGSLAEGNLGTGRHLNLVGPGPLDPDGITPLDHPARQSDTARPRWPVGA